MANRWLDALKKHENAPETGCQNRQNPSLDSSVSFGTAVFQQIQNFSDAPVSERAAFLTIEAGIPDVYADAFLAIQITSPEGVAESRWRQAIDDASRFLDRWGSTAAALGWPAADLFEFTATGCSGLAWQLQGREVIALTADEAILSTNDRTERAWFCRPFPSKLKERKI